MMFKFIVTGIGPDMLDDLEDRMNSGASRQLLLSHLKGNTEFNDMQNYLDNLGFPGETRNVSLVSGSNNGTSLDFNPGDCAYQFGIGDNCWFFTKTNIEINMTDINSHQRVSEIIHQQPPCITIDGETRYWDTGPKCFDNCPGGTFDISEYANCVDEFTFIPTVSAIDLEQSIIDGQNGLYYFNVDQGITKDYLINNNLTPFDDIYSDEYNSQHVYLGEEDCELIDNQIIVREIMFNGLYIQNKVIKYDREFSNDNFIIVGSDVNIWAEKNWEEGEVIFKSGTNIELNANEVVLDAGTEIELGCVFSVN